jgi:hypothetical protein
MDIFPPKSFGDWIACLAFAVVFCNGVMKLVDRFRGEEPHPPNASLGQSQEQLAERVNSLEVWRGDLTRKLEADKQAILLSGSQRGQRIYEKIDDEVKTLRIDMKEMNKDLTQKCEAIPSEVIALLKNTGAI